MCSRTSEPLAVLLKSKKTRIETDVIIQVGGIPIYVKIQENKDWKLWSAVLKTSGISEVKIQENKDWNSISRND